MTLKPEQTRRLLAVLDAAPSANILDLARLAGLPPERVFRGAVLRGADFRGLALAGYDFTGADFRDADARGTDFTGARGLERASLYGVIADAATLWPAGLARAPSTVPIRKGRFTIGTTLRELRAEHLPKQFWAWERPRRRITLAHDFILGKYPVTVGEFRRFIDDSGYVVPQGAYVWVEGKGFQHSDTAGWRDPGFPQDDRHPVTCVDFEDATAYTRWLSERTGQAWRLPSEAEWEYACRAGTRTARFWGDDRAAAAQYANVADLSLARAMQENPDPERFFQHDDGFPFTSPAGAFAPNPWGLHDMLGNVWEWCEDHYQDSYDNIPLDGTPNTTSGSSGRRVLRGASWYGYPWDVRAGYRVGDVAGDRNSSTGLRVARTYLSP